MKKKLKTVAIIPARGGSKGIPKKNMRKISGIPLVGHSILAALACKGVDQVVVSSDDEEILTYARFLGAVGVRRPDELSGDKASSESAILHVIGHLETELSTTFENILFIQCTSPLTQSSDFSQALKIMDEQKADCVFSASPFHGFVWKESAAGSLEGVNHDLTQRLRRQELQPQYLENGAFYLFKTESFLKKKHRFFGKVLCHQMPSARSIDIDDEQDLQLAAALMPHLSLQGVLAGRKPKAIVFDFDGVFTDNMVYVDENGVESVRCNRSDGMGVELLKQHRIPLLVLSKEKNPVVTARCKKLGLEVIQGTDEKAETLKHWLSERDISPLDVLFVGNDINDVECLRLVGVPVAVHDSHPAILSEVRIRLKNLGGAGAIRELADELSSMKS